MKMKLFNKKHYCLSACLLLTCNHAITPHANQNVIYALDLATLLPKQQTPKSFNPKTDSTFEAARKKLDQDIQAGEKMIQDAERKAREEFDKFFNESKPKQTPKNSEQNQPKNTNPTLKITLLARRFAIQNKLTYEEAQSFVANFSLLDEQNKLKTEENKTLYKALENWLLNNNEGDFSNSDLDDFEVKQNNNQQPQAKPTPKAKPFPKVQPSHNSSSENAAPKPKPQFPKKSVYDSDDEDEKPAPKATMPKPKPMPKKIDKDDEDW